MRIAIIGSGGREHALAWKMLQSNRVTKLFINATNASLSVLQKCYPKKSISFIDISDSNVDGIARYAKDHHIDLVLIGSEQPLALGLSDMLIKFGIMSFGPSQAAARIESSKAFAKDFMQRHGIRTAAYSVFDDCELAQKHLSEIDYQVVIKVSGLAGGKGVFIPDNLSDARDIIHKLSGQEIIIEERLSGEEVSLLAFSDGKNISALPLARDHKRLLDGNLGPNTGGMGAYAPVKLPAELSLNSLIDQTLKPAIDGLRQEGSPFVGVLYAGLMLTDSGVRVLEYNARFGDPETQVLMPLLKTDLLDILEACINGTLKNLAISWHDLSSVALVLASENYPYQPSPEQALGGIDQLANTKNLAVFHAGTKTLDSEQLVSSGGRILSVSAWGESLSQARESAYQAISQINCKSSFYRHDIASVANNNSYALAGVNIAAGNQAVALMKKAVRSSYGPEVLAGIGAFGGMYHAKAIKGMIDPVLVASTDGIGTKISLALSYKRSKTLGFDIVNHSVNDILVQGARPLFFLDYIAAAQLDPDFIAELVSQMADACKQVGCALLGGETAEMPGVYHPGGIDIAGTMVGVVERSRALPKANLKDQDILLGLASSGPHTNGYSLIRHIFKDIKLDDDIADALLKPHRCYLPILKATLDHEQQPIKALVHITGGGFFENIPRLLPENLRAELTAWPIPPLFLELQKRGHISWPEMYRVFNMGIGMVLIISPDHRELVKNLINEPLIAVGQLRKGQRSVSFI